MVTATRSLRPATAPARNVVNYIDRKMTDSSVSEDIESSNEPAKSSAARRIGPFTVRRWLVILGFGLLIWLMMDEVMDPYAATGYMEISHGDHKHYLPPDRDPNVSVSDFPTSLPGPNERITSTGQVVPK